MSDSDSTLNDTTTNATQQTTKTVLMPDFSEYQFELDRMKKGKAFPTLGKIMEDDDVNANGSPIMTNRSVRRPMSAVSRLPSTMRSQGPVIIQRVKYSTDSSSTTISSSSSSSSSSTNPSDISLASLFLKSQTLDQMDTSSTSDSDSDESTNNTNTSATDTLAIDDSTNSSSIDPSTSLDSSSSSTSSSTSSSASSSMSHLSTAMQQRPEVRKLLVPPSPHVSNLVCNMIAEVNHASAEDVQEQFKSLNPTAKIGTLLGLLSSGQELDKVVNRQKIPVKIQDRISKANSEPKNERVAGVAKRLRDLSFGV